LIVFVFLLCAFVTTPLLPIEPFTTCTLLLLLILLCCLCYSIAWSRRVMASVTIVEPLAVGQSSPTRATRLPRLNQRARTENVSSIGAPLDYSFMDIKSMDGIITATIAISCFIWLILCLPYRGAIT
jgi:hypothetical protein